MPSNQGFAAAVNRGLQEARGRWVCVLNNDVLLTDGWLDALCAAHEHHSRVGLVGPCTNYANGKQQLDWDLETDEQAMRALANRRARDHRGQVEDVSFLSGFCFLAPRALLLDLGGLEESYGAGTFEDSELCRSLRREGRRLLIAKDAFVYHFGNRTFRALGIDLVDQQAINQRHYLQRMSRDPLFTATEAFQEGDHRRALAACRDGLRQHPNDLECWRLGALCLLNLGAPETAARMLERYLAVCPDDSLRSLQATGIEFRPRLDQPAFSSGPELDRDSGETT